MPVRQSHRVIQPLRFDQKLILSRWFLEQLGGADFDTVTSDGIKEPRWEKVGPEGVSGFCTFLTSRVLDRPGLSNDDLHRYDANIMAHTATINEHRPEPIRWRYFQYLALLATEVYLDRWFRDPDGLLAELNRQVMLFNADQPDAEQLSPYAGDDLRKVAFWCATGSGKTLLLHINILQYRWYLEHYGRSSDIGHILLLTPNEALSVQHLDELRASGIPAEIFDKNSGALYQRGEVQVIDINKLGDEMGEKTVAVDAFGSNNLLLVDEGHLGARGSKEGQWMKYRNALCAWGFDFEYSATFGQAMSVSGDESLREQYAKCILFDYSYKYFYKDGYGKDYHILNLEKDLDAAHRKLYLTGAFLSFYQQLALYRDAGSTLNPYLLDRPLLILVGGSVNAQHMENGKPTTDVVDFMRFLAHVARDREACVKDIERLLSGATGIPDTAQHDVFANRFTYVAALQAQRGWHAADVYDDLLKTVFHASAPSKLQVRLIKPPSGEIALYTGDTGNEVFGLVNVGDASKLMKLCEEYPLDFVASEDQFGAPLFEAVHSNGSSVNVLLGAKKFMLGWNSWRVSTMGLMNVGRSEGSEIIQLFGRGVRLRGKGMCMKRTRMLDHERPPEHINILETLDLFGVRANYMDTFKKYMEDEGLPTEREHMTLQVMPLIHWQDLKILRIPEGLDFRHDGPSPVLGLPDDCILNSDLRERPVQLSWYPRVQSRISRGASAAADAVQLPTGKLGAQQLSFLNWDKLYYSLQEFKNQQGWFNLTLPRGAERALLEQNWWYTLFIEPDDLEFASFERVAVWQEIATRLLTKYCERSYTFSKDRWESEQAAFLPLQADDANFVREYSVDIDPTEQTTVLRLNELKAAIAEGRLAGIEWSRYRKIATYFERHLYQPLLCLSGSTVTVSPVGLNEGERKFVEDLRRYYDDNANFFKNKELYLLRNRSRGNGVGLFEGGNLYPDFIMWLVVEGHQYITFIDPKGITHLQGLDDPKIKLAKRIRDIERRLHDPSVTLNSFILSVTPEAQIPWGGQITPVDWTANHVLLQDQVEYIGLLLKHVDEPAGQIKSAREKGSSGMEVGHGH